ncbi:MAG: carboxypeptidase-like regulatory domain-containing protein, partial [Deltaproteobacteria bacterium]|nr:carboxypeptidase-like regulatory domain-containing protein [Deltaproteobacteria bacterium]
MSDDRDPPPDPALGPGDPPRPDDAPVPPEDDGPAPEIAADAPADAPTDQPADAPAAAPRSRGLMRAVLLIAIGAGLASIGFYLFGNHAAAPTSPIAVVLDDAGVLRPAHPPVLPAPTRGPGDQQLTGVVVDGAGLPIADVHVAAELEVGFATPDPARDAAVGPFEVTSTADATGRFTLDGLVAGRYRVRVQGDPIFTGELRMVGVPSDELRVVALRKVAVAGRVVDGGAPVGNAQVHLAGDGVTGRLTIASDSDGEFAFPELPEGTYQVWATAGDLAAPAQRALRQGAGPFPALELALEPAAIVVGRVVARATDPSGPHPVMAAVALYPASDGARGDEPPRFARTDRDGVFRIEGVPHGRWTAEAYAPGYVTTGVLAFEAGSSALTIELEPGGTIEGTVVDGAGRPVAGIEVRAYGSGPDGLAREASSIADDDHLRAFEGIAIAPPENAPASPTSDPRFVAKGELGVLLGPIPYPPPPTARAARRVTRVDDAPVSAGGSTATPIGAVAPPPPLPIDPTRAPIWETGADGAFRIPGLGRGTWVIVARGDAIAVTRSKPVSVATGAVSHVEIVVGPGVTLVGTVADQRGTPIAGA